MSPQKQFLNAIRALATYSENEENPYEGPEFIKLVRDVYSSIDDLGIEGLSAGRRYVERHT